MEKDIQKLGVKAREPKLLFTCREYTIEQIPLNYRITIKTERKSNRQAIEREFYSKPKDGIEYAHEVAKDAIDAYFTHTLPSKAKSKFGKR